MIWIAFDMHDLRRHVLSAVADRINDGAAADRAIGTGRPRLTGTCDLQDAQLRKCRLEVKPENSGSRATDSTYFQEISTRGMHRASLPHGEKPRARSYFLFLLRQESKQNFPVCALQTLGPLLRWAYPTKG